MAKLSREKLQTLEAYAKSRNDFRAEVMAHKRNRNVALGDHVTLIFEDEMTIRYQVQEMLRAEKIFEEAGIQDELDAYNPLIPDGSNWKATMLIEYEDIDERRRMLTQLLGIEDRVWVQVAGFDRVFAIADEDLERATEEKTSAVHFLRFELAAEMSKALKQGAGLSMGVDHPAYQATLDPVPPAIRESLLKDLQA
jgi:glycerol-3-phosphate dehydrogenase subunit C